MKEVKVLFSSGEFMVFHANNFNVHQTGSAEPKFTWNCEGAETWPAHINPKNVDAILLKEIETIEKIEK